MLEILIYCTWCIHKCNNSFNIFSEIGGRTLYRVIVGEAGGDTENALLNETVPSWVTSMIEDNSNGKFIKIQFYLQPHSSVPVHLLKQDRYKKVILWIYYCSVETGCDVISCDHI